MFHYNYCGSDSSEKRVKMMKQKKSLITENMMKSENSQVGMFFRLSIESTADPICKKHNSEIMTESMEKKQKKARMESCQIF